MESEVAFLSCYLTDLAVSFLFLVGFIYRGYTLSKRASEKNQSFRTSFWVTLTFLAVYVLVDIIEFVLALSVTTFYLYSQKNQLALILLLPISAVLMQMWVVLLEHRKK